MAACTDAPSDAVVEILCEVSRVSLSVDEAQSSSNSCEILISSNKLHFHQGSDGLTVRVGELELRLPPGGTMDAEEKMNGWIFLFPHSNEDVFSLRIFPQPGEAEKVEAVLSIFRQLSQEEAREAESSVSQAVRGGGEWLAKKIVAGGYNMASWIDKTGKKKVEGKTTEEVEISESTQKALEKARVGAGYLLKGTNFAVSFAFAGVKVVGSKMAEATRASGALEKLPVTSGSGSAKGRKCVEVGMASVDAALDVYHATKLAADVLANQTERTAVQVAGDLYGDDARRAAASGVGAAMDVGRAGAKVLQVATDEVEMALECAVEFADHTISLESIMKQPPILQGAVLRRDPMTLLWRERFASLCSAGLLIFKTEEALKAMNVKTPPQNMIAADDIYSVTKRDDDVTRLSVRTRDHVMHELKVLQDQRENWIDRLTEVQQASHRYQALAAGGQPVPVAA
eukprot:TRINITY_DN15147_c0_g1_i2.p1 TRINITY_DN15147_c0_g1~~TRINITY_DN15147_c0_g1_i2.p1  ORF type:complete len:471 (-),score=74.46 TRINITY_DN15147_c0_g1_i2:88-1458(-)